ncbi:hypothetical protein, partial [Klebsiella pneumoniae]|uniref:hypothetical protein n=1 Tax=Klebsiella pneumoniae TaxID=573 RepID=UPI003CF266AE
HPGLTTFGAKLAEIAGVGLNSKMAAATQHLLRDASERASLLATHQAIPEDHSKASRTIIQRQLRPADFKYSMRMQLTYTR